MKVRLDFVTNSSSSSYICDITGNVESGWDLCLSDAYMYECSNGHTFMDEFLVQDFIPPTYGEVRGILEENIKSAEKALAESPSRTWYHDTIKRANADLAELEENKTNAEWILDYANDVLEWNSRYDVNPKYCPICTLTNLSDSDCLAFFVKANKMDKNAVLAEIRKDFGTYQEFRNYLNKKD